jgi:hypothetical protein
MASYTPILTPFVVGTLVSVPPMSIQWQVIGRNCRWIKLKNTRNGVVHSLAVDEAMDMLNGGWVVVKDH